MVGITIHGQPGPKEDVFGLNIDAVTEAIHIRFSQMQI